MKKLQFLKEDELRLGVKTSHGILDVKDAADKLEKSTFVSLQELLLEGEEGLEKINSLVHLALEGNRNELFVSEGTLTYAPAVSNPEKIICVGLNYIDHAKESNMDTPKSPVLFSKFNNALSAHLETISIPEEAKNMDYEAELVAIMGKTAKNVSEEDALSYVFGYSVGNDVSARDLQFKSGQWLLGKTPDGFAPVGPYIVTAEEVDPNNLAIECRVNGGVRQKAHTRDMIFSCAFLISYISQYITLKPGDLIYTRTPEGVILGYPEGERDWLKSGDEMVVAIESLGELKNVLK
ncbi:fumarylacetoacetate hydrolase family protein [Peribacillus sp. NPDC094092]|uniref:fumarylacetoacetate hydrolase family protein n=1 Tax=Peribacillus sp. NPDC094092 TaxID=3390611 RepID=UPI003D05FCA6